MLLGKISSGPKQVFFLVFTMFTDKIGVADARWYEKEYLDHLQDHRKDFQEKIKQETFMI